MKHALATLTFTLSALLAACGDSRQTQHNTTSRTTEQYTCPMHPHYISTDPDQACPICGMDLVPVDTHNQIADGSVAVAPEMIQTMGIRTAIVEMNNVGRNLRAFGVVHANERLENAVASRLEGWIDHLAVRALGDWVAQGDLLYRIYSPNLIAAQKEYLNATRSGDTPHTNAIRQRLASLGMQSTAIKRLTNSQQVVEHIPVYAEANGVVTELTVRQGDYIRPGTPILRLQSYELVWVMASIPERDLSLISTGLNVGLDFPSAPSGPKQGRVDYIYPTIDPKTRTAQVRIEVDNTHGHLRPGAYANINLDLGSSPRLSIPTESLLRDSRGTHVIVALGQGRFAGRTVRTGIVNGNVTEILSGLDAGEKVVASGQFLLDSEVNLREGLSKLEPPTDANAGPNTPLWALPVDATTLAQINHVIDMALYIHEALTDGYRIDPLFLNPALDTIETLETQFANTRLIPILQKAATALQDTVNSPETTTLTTHLARLMDALNPWLTQGKPNTYRDAGLALFSDTATDRLWLQESLTPLNPYGNHAARLIPWPTPKTHPPKTHPPKTHPNNSQLPSQAHAGHRH